MLGCLGSTFFTLFILAWCGGTVYFMYAAAKDLDSSLHYAPTNCTITSMHYDSDNTLYMYANYTLPGNNFNSTAFVNNVDDNANYFVGQTLSCFYALHDHSYLMAQVGVHAGVVVMMVFSTIMCIPVAIGAVFVLSMPVIIISPMVVKLAKSIKAFACETGVKMSTIFKRKPDNGQDNCGDSTPSRSIGSSVIGYLMLPVNYFKAALGSSASWLKAKFTRNKLGKGQQQDMYDLEDQGSLKSRASSGYSFRSSKKLLSHSKSQRSDMTDQSSVETRSL
ncbi:hypothetical protein K450DRAFT_300032 [Umbelopsis ramanniana AG]|uniref:Uncharacterized protein n=1 Tax=Umbelopsis ramanniana AG TaxID=1314678 RepID=A0AAD5EAI0_UMBRA|nr:uncharacterized protein K450DRAFT_300032 [Umbelopsis ramanniana AG]KAI8579832.1 hypothetical protein K450DRAFT_300032 [Umbelopsis ramanniana AG]